MVNFANGFFVLARIVELIKHALDQGDPAPALVIGADNRPGRMLGMGALDHLVARIRIIVPPAQSLQINRGELPHLERIVTAIMEPLELHLAANRQPELEQVNAIPGDAPLEFGRFFQEMFGLLGGAEAHDLFDAGAVVPGAIKQHRLGGGGHPFDIALEIPLRALAIVGLGQRRDDVVARIEIFHIALDGAALAGGIASLEHDHDPLAGRQQVRLQCHQLLLQIVHLGFIDIAIQLILVRIAA